MAHILLRVTNTEGQFTLILYVSYQLVTFTNGSKTSSCFGRILSVIHMHYILIYTN